MVVSCPLVVREGTAISMLIYSSIMCFVMKKVKKENAIMLHFEREVVDLELINEMLKMLHHVNLG